MDTTVLEHKFFERYLNNDLNYLKKFLLIKYEYILSKNNNDVIDHKPTPTELGHTYNIFKFEEESINNLKNSIKSMILEACEYYKINYEDQEYMIHGWFNYDIYNHKYHEKHMHDHSGGNGVPDFHGYYCVDAEPSVTHYSINKDKSYIFENINKNNRAIISETGHPHARGDWNESFPRITIAYDISPKKNIIGDQKDWISI